MLTHTCDIVVVANCEVDLLLVLEASVGTYSIEIYDIGVDKYVATIWVVIFKCFIFVVLEAEMSL